MIEITTNELRKAITTAKSVIDYTTKKLVLQNVMLAASDGFLWMESTDLQCHFRERITGLNPKGKMNPILIDVREMATAMKGKPKTIQMEVKGEELIIVAGKLKQTIKGNATDEYPGFVKREEMSAKPIATLSFEAFSDAWDRVSFLRSKGDTRFALNGVMMKVEKGLVSICASDTHRLALAKLKTNTNVKPQGKYQYIVCDSTCQVLERIGSNANLEIYSKNDNLGLVFITEEFEISTRLVDGQFPRYEEVIPKNCEDGFEVDVEEFRQALKTILPTANKETHAVCIRRDEADCLELKTDNATILVENADVSRLVACTFNGNYLLDLLDTTEEEKVFIKEVDSDTPILFEDRDYSHIVMPIRPKTEDKHKRRCFVCDCFYDYEPKVGRKFDGKRFCSEECSARFGMTAAKAKPVKTKVVEVNTPKLAKKAKAKPVKEAKAKAKKEKAPKEKNEEKECSTEGFVGETDEIEVMLPKSFKSEITILVGQVADGTYRIGCTIRTPKSGVLSGLNPKSKSYKTYSGAIVSGLNAAKKHVPEKLHRYVAYAIEDVKTWTESIGA